MHKSQLTWSKNFIETKLLERCINPYNELNFLEHFASWQVLPAFLFCCTLPWSHLDVLIRPPCSCLFGVICFFHWHLNKTWLGFKNVAWKTHSKLLLFCLCGCREKVNPTIHPTFMSLYLSYQIYLTRIDQKWTYGLI